MFGTPVGLNYKGNQAYGTVVGGCTTMLLQLLIVIFLIKQSMSVYEYNEPTISAFEIMEDRSTMEEPLNLEDMHQSFIFGFIDRVTTLPAPLDPRVGFFELALNSLSYVDDDQADFIMSRKNLTIVPLSQKSEEEKNRWQQFGQSEFMFTPENLADAPLQGALFDPNTA